MKKLGIEFYFTLNQDEEAHETSRIVISTYCDANNMELVYYREMNPPVPLVREVRVRAKSAGKIKKFFKDTNIEPENFFSGRRMRKRKQ